MLDVILDTALDAFKLLPFLFVTYLVMEYLEHRAGERMRLRILASGRLGPLVGAALGALPQCGFSAASSSLYAGGVVTAGTLIAVYMSTSDEMLPMLVSERREVSLILSVIAIKALTGMICGFIVDLIYRKVAPVHMGKEKTIARMCQEEHCSCEKGILGSAVRHTLEILCYIFVVTLVLNIIIHFLGTEYLRSSLFGMPVLSEMLAALVGLIPGCGASVTITQLYIEGIIRLPVMLSGLMCATGSGLIVLIRTNRDVRDNLRIILLLYALSVVAGTIFELISLG